MTAQILNKASVRFYDELIYKYVGRYKYLELPIKLIWFNSAVVNTTEYFWDRERHQKFIETHYLDRKFPVYTIQFTTRGFGYYEYRSNNLSNRFKVTAGKLFLIAPFIDYQYYFASSEPWHFIWINMTGPYAEKLFCDIYHRHGPVLEVGTDSSTARQIRNILKKPYEGIFRSPFILSAEAYRLMQELNSNLNSMQEKLPLASKIQSFISENIKSVDVDAIAAHLSVSKSHLTHLLKKKINITPHEFILKCRIETACELLLKTNTRIREIAYACGMPNQSHFIKIFRRLTGKTPKKFRETKGLNRIITEDLHLKTERERELCKYSDEQILTLLSQNEMKSLPIQLAWMNYSIIDKENYHWTRQSHKLYHIAHKIPPDKNRIVLQYTTKGNGFYEYTKGKKKIKIKIKPGDLFIAAPFIDYEYYYKSGAPWHCFWFKVYGEYADSVMREIYHAFGPVVHLGEYSRIAKRLIEFQSQPLKKVIQNPLILSAEVYTLIQELRGNLFNMETDTDFLSKVNNLVSINIKDINLFSLARHFSLSKSHFSHIFKEKYKITPNDYITSVKIEIAKKLMIQNPELTIQGIADSCGFKNATYFSYVFKKKTGGSPLVFRKSINSTV